MLHRIVIIGGGFAGLNTIRGLKNCDCEILLIDKSNSHVFQPLLYQVATASLGESSISKPLREIFKNQKNVTVQMDCIVSADRGAKKLITQKGDEIPYDTLIIATGAKHSYFGNPHFEPFAPGLKTLEDALKIKERLLYAFEKAEKSRNQAQSVENLVFIVIGGGPTGVELAGSIAEFKNLTLKKDFHRIDPKKARVLLIEGLQEVLPPYPESLRKQAHKDLEALGVEILTNTKVTNVLAHGVETDKGFLHAEVIIWAAGNQASSMLKTLGVELDRQGRAIVGPYLQIPGDENVFVIGDAAHFKGIDGNPLPGIAPVAIQMGSYIAKRIKEKLLGRPFKKPFKYFDKGMMAIIGSFRAVAISGGLKLKGFFAWFAWLFIHILYIVTFRNRLIVALDWITHYLTGRSRNYRVIIRPAEELDEEN